MPKTMISLHSLSDKYVGVALHVAVRENHRLHRLEAPGRWFGAGKKILHLLGRQPTQNRLLNLLQGLSPNGKVRMVHDALEPSLGVMVRGNLVELSAFLVQPKPRTLAVLVVILNSHSNGGADASKTVNHHANQRTVAKADHG